MKEQLTINGKEVDLIPKSITRKIRLAELGNLNNKNSSFSNQFKLPRTSKNTAIFEMLGVIGNTSTIPYTEIRANYSVDTIPLVNQGYLTVESLDEKYINVRLRDGLTDLGERLKGLKLSDLPLSDYNHFFNGQTFTDSFNNTEGYIYAYGDFGQGFTKVEYQAPSIFIHTIWQRIFAGIGVDYEGDIFTNNSKFLNEVLAPSIGYVPVDSPATLTDRGDASSNTISELQQSTSPLSFDEKHIYSNVNLNGFTANSTSDIVCNINGRIQIEVDTQYSNFNTFLYVRIDVNGMGKSIIQLPESINTQNLITSVNLTVQSGDIINVRVVGRSKTGGNNFDVNYSVNNRLSFSSASGGQLIEISNLLGDMTQLDFIKDVMMRYALFPIPQKDNLNAYEFKQIKDVLSNKQNALNWTNKLVSYGTEKYDNGLARENKFTFRYPDDTQSFEKDSSFNIDNFNLKASDTYYSSPFEIPSSRISFKNEPLYYVETFVDEDGTIEAGENNPKIFNVIRKNETLTIAYFDDGTYSYTGNVAFLNLDDIDMNEFISDNYTEYTSAMQNYVERDCTLNLSNIDIHNLELDRLYYFEQLSKYCLIQEVQHKVGDLAKVKMIQL